MNKGWNRLHKRFVIKLTEEFTASAYDPWKFAVWNEKTACRYNKFISIRDRTDILRDGEKERERKGIIVETTGTTSIIKK